ncbi:beta subunit of hydroxylase component of benzoate 1,2-dioxygenase [Isoalcanivorax pacificus W11-5]|uniref:Beta subunit of hydroxylase component of benzoate 1,2-dioxygenase n=1 Tax=Isoalcanivorax pacificus W11-5 TaxID=391936 RepID=A0A0B4XPI5_9GAMM|nr:aromatic-ring-hydroxylating dioxygenase subunit beta [Isoalcanivorax pacificus]AJD49071.1 beta subunit of hydroxylase component of benzoate 1,2-dioxygenase [Isoalcanivorax pacificus W11-5]
MAQQIVKAMPEVIHQGIVDTQTQQRLERFLALEAALMDAHEYDRWLALWDSDEVLYWVPCNSDEQDPSTGIAIIYDDRTRLLERIMRLKDKTAHAYRPLAKLVRSVSGVLPLSVDGDEMEVAASFVLGETRVGQQNLWLGKTLYRLVDTANGFRIRSKKVMLLNNDDAMPNLTFLV